jgi:hypothetical protein
LILWKSQSPNFERSSTKSRPNYLERGGAMTDKRTPLTAGTDVEPNWREMYMECAKNMRAEVSSLESRLQAVSEAAQRVVTCWDKASNFSAALGVMEEEQAIEALRKVLAPPTEPTERKP